MTQISRPGIRPQPKPAPRATADVPDTISEAYLRQLGAYQNIRMATDPATTLMVIAGRAGRGKSSLFHSCPHAYVFNCDISSTPRKPKAMVWPGVRSDKTPVERNPSAPNDPEKGNPIQLAWPLMLEKRAVLLEMAAKDIPNRPKLCVMDTTDAAASLCEQWMVDEFNREHPTNIKESFYDIGTGGQYPKLYEHVWEFGAGLNKAGYGFVWIFHLRDKQITERVGNQSSTRLLTDQPQTWPNLWNLLLGNVELVGVLDQERRSQMVQVPVRGPDGKQKVLNGKSQFRPEQRSEQVCMLRVTPSATSDFVKTRWAGLDQDILLPKSDPWAAFESTIRAADAAEDR